MTKTRVAICISGQIRSSDDRLAEIQREAEAIGADVFISVWELRGGKTFDAGHRSLNMFRIFGPKAAMFFPQNWVEGLRDIFPDWKNLLPDPSVITHKNLKKIFPDAIIDIEADKPELDLPAEMNSLRMLYKIARCNRMKQDYEAENGFRYDRVIRTRPDILLSFQSIIEAPYTDGEVHLKIRGGQTLHDTYWAGSSGVDDTMAGFFDQAIAERKDDWKGIHPELAAFVKKTELKPVNLHFVKTGFDVFGEYSTNEKAKIFDNFRKEIPNIDARSGNGGSEAFKALMAEVFSAVGKDFDRAGLASPSAPLKKLVLSMQENLADNAELFLALPPVTTLLALDDTLTENARGALVFDLLTNDALIWPTYFPLRAARLIENLPSRGVELLPYLMNSKTPHTAGKTDELGHFLIDLWQKRFHETDAAALQIAREKVVKTVLNNNQSRSLMANFLKDNGRFDEYLSLAQAYKTAFPERANAGRFLLQAQNLREKQNPA